MGTTGAGLKLLHELHLQLRDVQSELDLGPRQIAARRQALDRKLADLEARRQKLKQAKMTADQKNLQLKTNETKIAELKAKQNAVTSNREYDILRGQIEADTMAKSVLEDEIIEALETVDRTQVEVKQAEQEVAAAEAELRKFVEEVEQKIPGLKARADALRAQVADAEKFLPPQITAEYRRLVLVHGADALAPVDNRSCSNCYLTLTQQMMVELKSGKLLFCKSCGRLLYLPGNA
jgi:predicted  nucleic acid-binding Zn-ribbon protein